MYIFTIGCSSLMMYFLLAILYIPISMNKLLILMPLQRAGTCQVGLNRMGHFQGRWGPLGE